MLATLFPMVKLVRPVQPSKPPRLVTLSGIVTLVRPVQPQKAPSSIVVTLLPNVKRVILLQLEKALFPILVTLFGMISSVSFWVKKALFPMLVTPFPNVKLERSPH